MVKPAYQIIDVNIHTHGAQFVSHVVAAATTAQLEGGQCPQRALSAGYSTLPQSQQPDPPRQALRHLIERILAWQGSGTASRGSHPSMVLPRCRPQKTTPLRLQQNTKTRFRFRHLSRTGFRRQRAILM